MKLNELKPLNEADFNYSGEIDPQISNIPGQPYSMYVNEADRKLPHSITFLVSSDDDDGVVWEVDLGAPAGQSTNYEPASDHGPGGHEVHWERNTPTHGVLVDDLTNNPTLKQMVPQITKQLTQLQQAGNIEQAHKLFAQILQRLNGV